jgi:hypothetical protein
MNTKKQIIMWVAFWLFAVLTWVVYSGLWMKGWYYLALSALGIISLFLAIGILATKGRTCRSIILIVLGLVIGQWWLIESLAMMALWGIRGFAP